MSCPRKSRSWEAHRGQTWCLLQGPCPRNDLAAQMWWAPGYECCLSHSSPRTRQCPAHTRHRGKYLEANSRAPLTGTPLQGAPWTHQPVPSLLYPPRRLSAPSSQPTTHKIYKKQTCSGSHRKRISCRVWAQWTLKKFALKINGSLKSGRQGTVCLCMSLCSRVCVHVCLSVYLCVCACLYACVDVQVSMHVCVFPCVCACVSRHVCACSEIKNLFKK